MLNKKIVMLCQDSTLYFWSSFCSIRSYIIDNCTVISSYLLNIPWPYFANNLNWLTGCVTNDELPMDKH